MDFSKNICPICNHDQCQNLIDFKDSNQFINESFNSFEMKKKVCDKCNHIYISYLKNYDIEGHYQSARSSKSDLIYSNASKVVKEEFSNLADWVSDAVSKPQQILDIGCGKCELLYALKNKFKSAEVFGIDYSPDSVEHGKSLGISSVEAKNLYEVFNKDKKYDFISATGVLEHQYDLKKFLKRMKGLSKSNTTYLIQVPDSISILARKDLGSKYMHDLYNDEHVHHFNIENLSNLLISNGFQIIKHKKTRRNDWDLIDILFKGKSDDDNNDIKFLKSAEENDFLFKFKKKRANDILRFNKEIKKSISIGIYGAGWHTCVVLPSYYNFSFKNVDVIFDMDTRKQGKNLFDIDVKNPTKEEVLMLDLIIISSINLNNEITNFLVDLGIPKKKIVSLYN